MYTKVIILALVTIVRCHDVIVGLKTDGTKFFDENRQANPALWRQMDNVTIKAPENEVISRVVITDLRPDKDGDVKIVEGGEGQKNVTIELKSPTVLRGYEFHIEVFSVPEGQIPLVDVQSTTEAHDEATKTADETSSNNPESNSHTSDQPNIVTDKSVPAILTKDEASSERQGRNANTDDSSTTTEFTSTTLKNDVTTTQHSESVTDNGNNESDVPNTNDAKVSNQPIPLNKNFNINLPNPAVKAMDNNKNSEADKTGNPTDFKFNLTPINLHFHESTENNKEASTENNDIKPVEEKSEDQEESNTPKLHTFENRKFTAFIPSKSVHPGGPIEASEDEKLRNTRDAEMDHTTTESELGETTTDSARTTAFEDETSTQSVECDSAESNEQVEANSQIPKMTAQGTADMKPVYLNNGQWDRINNPRFQSQGFLQNDQKSVDMKPIPALIGDDSTNAPDNEAVTFENGYKPSPKLMESKTRK